MFCLLLNKKERQPPKINCFNSFREYFTTLPKRKSFW